MNKNERKKILLDIIGSKEIETQEELKREFEKRGIAMSQATLSRDINELGLIKIASENGGQHYARPASKDNKSKGSYAHVLSTGMISVDTADKLIVLGTESGVAMAAATALDHMDIPGLVGSIAGDDTIFLAVKAEHEKEIIELIGRMI